MLALARGLPGHHVIAAPDDGPLLSNAGASGIETHPLPFSGKYTFVGSALHLVRAFRRADFVHVHGQYAAFYAAPLARANGARVIYTAHFPSFVTDTGRRTRARNQLVERVSCAASNLVVSCSESMRAEYLKRQLTTPDRIVTIYNGVSRTAPSTDLLALRAEMQLDERDVVVMALGRFTEQKGFDVLLNAMPALRARRPHLKLLLVGDGYERSKLVAQARRLELNESVRFTGFRNDAGAVLALADVVVVPSRYDVFPLVPLEAMMAGKAIVASNLPVLREAVEDGVTGVLVPLEPARIAAAVLDLLQDPQRRRALGNAARARAEALFSTEVMLGRYAGAYASLEARGP